MLNPISSIGFYLMPAGLTGMTDPLTWQTYPDLLGLGPLWFVAMLLIFSFGYAGWRMLAANRPSTSSRDASVPGYLWIGLFILALALASYLMRIVIPIGKSVFHFPTLAYLPQYLSFFIIGTVASRHNWARTLPGSMGVVGFVAALVATVSLFSVAVISLLMAIERAAQQLPPFGYGTWQSAVYALWDSTFAVGMVLAVSALFRRFFNRQRWLGSFLAQHSYTVYIIHIPIIVFIAFALRGLDLGTILKFCLVTIIVVPTCFVVAAVVRKIPLAARVL